MAESRQLNKVQDLNGHTDRVWSVAWNPDGTVLASCGGDQTIRLWGINTEGSQWYNRTVLTGGHNRTIRSVSWSPCGNFLGAASFDGTVSIWTKQSGEFVCNTSLSGHDNEVKSVAWSKSGLYIATCSRDKTVWIWEAVDEGEEFECISILSAHTQDMKKVLWHPVDDVLVSASYDNNLKMYKYDGDDFVCFATLSSHTSTVWSMCFDEKGKRLVSCSDDTTIKLWKEYLPGNPEGIGTIDNDPTWKCIATLSGYHTRPVYDIDWCSNTGLIVSASGDDCISVFQIDSDSDPNAPTLSLVTRVEQAHSRDVNSVKWNLKVPGVVASAGDDQIVTIWKINTSMM